MRAVCPVHLLLQLMTQITGTYGKDFKSVTIREALISTLIRSASSNVWCHKYSVYITCSSPLVKLADMAIKTPPSLPLYLYPIQISFLLRCGNNMAYSHWCSTDTNAPRTMTCDPIFVASRREIGQICGRMTVRHDNDCMRQRKVYGSCVKAGCRILNAEGRIR